MIDEIGNDRDKRDIETIRTEKKLIKDLLNLGWQEYTSSNNKWCLGKDNRYLYCEYETNLYYCENKFVETMPLELDEFIIYLKNANILPEDKMINDNLKKLKKTQIS